MARPKKPEEKPKDGATLSIDVDSFVRTRDSVVTGLATLQDAIQTLSSAYIKHTNAVLGEHGAGLDVDSALARLGQHPLLSLGDLNRAISPAAAAAAAAASSSSASAAKSAVADTKERRKRTHDPNAPKRPLTPFFLYMQTARPIIAEDLGSEFSKGAVSAEGTRRWTTMDIEDKQLWTNAYKDNLRLYNARMHAYKAGDAHAKDMSDQEATSYAEQHNIGADHAQLVGESSAAAAALLDDDAEGEPDKEPTPPPKTPKAKSHSRKSKASKNSTPVVVPTPVVPTSASSIVPPKAAEKEKEKEKERSPDKKRKRSSKKDELVAAAAAAAAAAEKEEMAVETPKSAVAKPRKKKTKSES